MVYRKRLLWGVFFLLMQLNVCSLKIVFTGNVTSVDCAT